MYQIQPIIRTTTNENDKNAYFYNVQGTPSMIIYNIWNTLDKVL